MELNSESLFFRFARILTLGVLLMSLAPITAVHAGLREGIDAFALDHRRDALRELLPLAERGNGVAQFYVGRIFLSSGGAFRNNVKADRVKALTWLQSAAAKDIASAQYELSLAFRTGSLRFTKNEVAANDWLAQAVASAEGGLKTGNWQDHILIFVIRSQSDTLGAKLDALAVLRTAAAAGDLEAQTWMALVGSTAGGSEAEATRRATVIANKGSSHGANILASKYEFGKGEARNGVQAPKWYQTAFDLGDSEAVDRIANIYKEGVLVRQDIDEAVRWWRIQMSQTDEKDHPWLQLKIMRAREVQSGTKDTKADQLEQQLLAQLSDTSPPSPQQSPAKAPTLTSPCGWKEVQSDSTTGVFLYDPCTLKKQGKYSMVWVMEDYKSLQRPNGGSTAYQSEKARYAFDCGADRAARSGVARYAGRLGDGDVVFSHSFSESEWRFRDVLPGSVLESAMQFACRR